MKAVGKTGHRVLLDRREDDSIVHSELFTDLNTFIIKHVRIQSAKLFLCLCISVVSFFVITRIY